VTNIPREVSICFSCRIALSSVAELLAWSICRRSAFRAGSLSLIVHRQANTLASWKLAIRTLWLTPGKWASKEFVCGRDISPASRTKTRGVNSTVNSGAASGRGFRPHEQKCGQDRVPKGVRMVRSRPPAQVSLLAGELAIAFEPSVNGKRPQSNRFDVYQWAYCHQVLI
jgi:hypothetical protein